MRQLRHFIKTDTHGRSKDFTDKELGQLAKWSAEDEEYGDTHCEECGGPKTRPEVDLCYNCAKKKAASMGHNMLPHEYHN